MGVGCIEIVCVVIGVDYCDGGIIMIVGCVVWISQFVDVVKYGVGYLFEDCKLFGLMFEQDVMFNIVFVLFGFYVNVIGWMGDSKVKNCIKEYVQQLWVKMFLVNQVVKFFFGGNQQKVVIVCWLMCDCDIFIFDELICGIDVGVKEEIYCFMQQFVDVGKFIIVILLEFFEIFCVVNCIVVFVNGCIIGMFCNEEVSQEKIM